MNPIPPVKSEVDAKNSCNSACCVPKKKKPQYDHELHIESDDPLEKVNIVFQKHAKEIKEEKHKTKHKVRK